MAQARFGDMVKAVVDVERGVMAVSGELHSDEEALLLDQRAPAVTCPRSSRPTRA